jgi:hypothetical protein
MEKAKNWIYSKGRDLEITMYNAIFLDDKEDLLTSLTLYLSEDGGFGNQLYYNKLGSTVFETYYALKILIDCNYDLGDSDDILENAYTYLFNNNFESTPYFAGLVGCGLKLLDKTKANYKKCLELNSKVKKDYSSKDLETFKSYILYANATLDKDIIDKLKKDLVNVVETAEIEPFELINNDLLATDELMPKIKENIKKIKKARLESGAWLYEDIDDIETIKKSGTLTISNMLILKNFKAI